jgi:peptidoglycan/LPS O-acetylase OafA/YrhL
MSTTAPTDYDKPPIGETSTGGRLVFVDVLRVVLIVLVVAHHAGQAYGPTGGDWPVTEPESMDWLGSFFAVNASFFMGLLFLLAGYFVPRSYDRRGPGVFLKGRWKRLGIPLVVLALVVHIPGAYFMDEESSGFGEFLRHAYDNGLQEVFIHLWFLGHLLFYSALYALGRWVLDRRNASERVTWPVPGHGAIVAFVVALMLVSWIVRSSYHIDEWVPLFFVLATEPAHLPQYMSLFAIGVIAYRGDWLRRISTTTGMLWLTIGVAASAALYLVRTFSPETWRDVVNTGEGLNAESLIYPAWEALICAGLSVGLIVLFRERFNRAGTLLTAMAAASYTAYILHWMVVVFTQMGLEGVAIPILAKFLIVTAVGVVLAFWLGHLARRVPGLRIILGIQPTPAKAVEPETSTTEPKPGVR